jgi:DNA polymerase I-like protein with 3'-5' exonuclease and polymerase domains
MHDTLRCLGIGCADGRVAVIPFRSVETGECPWYTDGEMRQINEIVAAYLSSSAWPKGGWNSAVYDALVLKHHFGIIPTPSVDGIPWHRVAEPEMKHSLGVAGGIYTDVDKWKAGHTAVETQKDEELWQYNATDCVVTALTIPAVVGVVKSRNQVEQARTFAKLADVSRGLHETGIMVDQVKRREWDRKLLAQAQKHKRRIRELARWPELNPASSQQVADLLFERLHIAPYSWSEKTGEPSTEDDALRAFLSSTWDLPPEKKALVTAIRDFRRVTKRRGVVVRLRPITDPYFEDETLVDFEETEEERRERHQRAKKGKATRACGLVLPDGRVHADWLAHGTVGWRFSSSKPNMQNLENKLRDMFIAAPGHVLVGCDEAQLELRMVAGLAHCAYYLEKFNAGADPHFDLCVDVFGEPFLKASKDGQKKLRVCVKQLTYSGLYRAGNETKHEIITSAEDDNEALLFPDFTMREVAAFTDAWHRRNPEVEVWWDSLVVEYRRQHYLEEPVMHLRLDFLDGEEPEKLANFKPQAGGAALVHRACFRALDEIPFMRWGAGTGLIQQGHDSLVMEVPESEGERTKKILEEAMTEHGRAFGLDLPFLGEGKVGKNLKEV